MNFDAITWRARFKIDRAGILHITWRKLLHSIWLIQRLNYNLLCIYSSLLIITELFDPEARRTGSTRRARDNSQSINYQHIFSPNTVAQFSLFNRFSKSGLSSNPTSSPVVASQNRTLRNYVGIGSLSLTRGSHNSTTTSHFSLTVRVTRS